jgi:hypothetical protein
MALDFPSNPVDGQVSGNYIWSSSSGAWKSKPTVGSVTIQSPTVPATANAGDIWVNTNDGTAFSYFDDGTSRQWMEIISSGVPNLASKADLSYTNTQLALKSNIASPSFTGTVTAEYISASQRVIGTTPNDSGSTGGLAVKAPSAGSQTSAYLQFVNNAYSAQYASIEATPGGAMNLWASYVKMPSQPTFFAWQQEGVGTYSTTSITNPIFTSTLVNTGGNYSTSTGRFTAPISGTYEFNCMLLVRSSSVAAEMTFRKNGANVVGRNLAYSNPSGAGGHDPAHYSIFIDMSAGDYVTPWISVNGGSGTDIYYGGGLGWFSGRLVG